MLPLSHCKSILPYKNRKVNIKCINLKFKVKNASVRIDINTFFVIEIYKLGLNLISCAVKIEVKLLAFLLSINYADCGAHVLTEALNLIHLSAVEYSALHVVMVRNIKLLLDIRGGESDSGNAKDIVRLSRREKEV